jgi:hypothetical protein
MPLENTRDSGLTFIEQLQIKCAETCTKEKRPYITGVTVLYEKILLCRPFCKQWNCPSCAARNARIWIAKIINHVNHSEHENWQMFTLTAHEKMRGRVASVKNLRRGWKRLYNRMRSTFGISEYAKVWESHKDGSFHLHGLIAQNIGKRWLKDNARSCGMGYQVEISKIENAGQVAGYISKYFLKSEVIGEYPKGMRRIEVSRNWKKFEQITLETDMEWTINQTREGQLSTRDYYKNIYQFPVVDTVREGEP